MKIKIVWFFVCILSAIRISADNITIHDFSISPGETKEFNIELNNDIAYAAFQFDLYLPSGLLLLDYHTDNNRVPTSTSLTMNKQADGSYRFLSVAMEAKNITGNNGSIVIIKVVAKEDIEGNDLVGYFKNIKLSKADATGNIYETMSFPIKILGAAIVKAKNVERLYGDTNPSFEYELSGTPVNGYPELTCSATPTSPVGVYDIIVKQGSITNNNVTYQKGTLTVKPAPLTISVGTYTKKQGEENPDFSLKYEGFKNDETVDILTKKPTIATTVTKETPVGVYPITVSGAEAVNYNINYVNGTLEVTAAEPTIVTAKNYTRVYGDENPIFEYTSSGPALSGIPEISCEATPTSPVGTYPIIIKKGGVTNYNDSYVNGTLTITKAPLTIKAGTYFKKHGDDNPEFTIIYEGFKNGETETVLSKQVVTTCEAEKSSAPGEYLVKLSGAESPNYSITYIDGKLIIEDNPVIITAKSYSREYGEDNPTFEYTTEGAELNGNPVIECAATTTSAVGVYDITVSKGTVKNYNDSYVNGTLAVTKAPLTIKVGNYTRKQGEDNPEFVLEYDGFKNGETADVLLKQPTVLTEAEKDSEPGIYAISIYGAEAENYEITYVMGELTVNEADPVTVTAMSYTREYGEENPEFDFTFEGAALDGKPEIECEATSTSDAGTYDIIVKQGSIKNHNVTYVAGTLTITQAPLTIKAGTYLKKQGDPLPEFKLTYEGFKNNDTNEVLTKQAVISCDATENTAPGEYDVTVSGAEAKNYIISYVDGKLIVTDADAVVIMAKSYVREYGEENPTFEYEVSGATLDGTPDITCEATATSAVGVYDITVSKGTVKNYNDSYVNGTLTITKAPLKVTVKDVEREQGTENPQFEIVYEGWKLQESESVLIKKPIANTVATKDSPVGEYIITVNDGEAQNYELTYQNGKLTVTIPDSLTKLMKSGRPFDIYDMKGRKVRHQVTTLKELPKGVYIISGKKMIVR